ncbi:MAG TPA: tetratricopeptide repeat protein, partial [Polyangiaceae bacterium]
MAHRSEGSDQVTPEGGGAHASRAELENESAAYDAAWDPSVQSLARSLSLSDGFLFLLVTVASRHDADVALREIEVGVRALRGARVEMVRIDPYANRDPGAAFSEQELLQAVLPLLVKPAAGGANDAIVWLDATLAPVPPLGGDAGRDDAVWRSLFRRMNEQRNTITRALAAPLVFAGPKRLTQAFAHEAPDFWSIRSGGIALPLFPGAPRNERPDIQDEYQEVLDSATVERELRRLEDEIAELRERCEREPDEVKHRAALAGSLSREGGVLALLGRFERALDATQEATESWRQVTREKALFLPGLAGTLMSQSNRLSQLGRLDEALETARESVEIYRSLARRELDAYAQFLAAALLTLGSCLRQ